VHPGFVPSSQDVVVQLEISLDGKKIIDVIMIDLISDPTSVEGDSAVDRANTSFYYRYLVLTSIRNITGLKKQYYTKNLNELTIDEGFFITPMFSSRIVYKRGRNVGSSAYYVKNFYEVDYAFPVEISHNSGIIKLTFEFYFTDYGVTFKGIRPHKDKPTGPMEGTLEINELLNFLDVASKYQQTYNKDMHFRLGQLSYDGLSSHVMQYFHSVLGSVSVRNYFPEGAWTLMEKLNHLPGSDSCQVCVAYNKWKKTGKFDMPSKPYKANQLFGVRDDVDLPAGVRSSVVRNKRMVERVDPVDLKQPVRRLDREKCAPHTRSLKADENLRRIRLCNERERLLIPVERRYRQTMDSFNLSEVHNLDPVQDATLDVMMDQNQIRYLAEQREVEDKIIRMFGTNGPR